MKTFIITFLLFHLSITIFSQRLDFRDAPKEVLIQVRNTYSKPANQEVLSEANKLEEIYIGYPASWINDYISTEISVIANGKVETAVSKNDVLTTKQKELIMKADVGTDIAVEVKHKTTTEVKTLNFAVSVLPEFEAEYIGGYEQLKQYVKEKAIDKFAEITDDPMLVVRLNFTIDEEGKIINAQITQSSEEEAIDKLLLEVICNMPEWKPAGDANGQKIKQEFELVLGNGC